MYICTRKCSLNDFAVVYFAEIKQFLEYFEATTRVSHRKKVQAETVYSKCPSEGEAMFMRDNTYF